MHLLVKRNFDINQNARYNDKNLFQPLKMRLLCCVEALGKQLLSAVASYPRRMEASAAWLKTQKFCIFVIVYYGFKIFVMCKKVPDGHTMLLVMIRVMRSVFLR